MKYNILVVDDEVNNLELLMRTFRRKHQVFMASSGNEALEILKNNKIDLIITDQRMPGMDGSEFLKHTLQISPDSIRILVTGYTDASALIAAINEGKIYRYIKKPWNVDEVNNIVENALNIYKLNTENQELTLNLKDLFAGTITAITKALDAKDPFTYGKSKKVTFYALETGKKLGMSESELGELELAGLLHDIGMIGISESIINKQGNLTQEEYEAVKEHVRLGVKILENIKQLGTVVNIIKYHHEHYDGNGYPYGFSGESIPVGSRIIAIADAYDSMVSDRAYRKGLPHEVAIEEISKKSGTQFDPEIVNVFLSIIENARIQMREITSLFAE